ncbi:Serine hydroxymethyltransferase [Pseudolycoriella hygida]|uniref:Serine hydroxymethyltransferase n=1 Tax=Pseudolycoriella hygida TaxID=35572 RepID=A0A9Q0N761_9DIPT|nr:Serine hydroxymethyltransferase [Pseudolycoriella hygida]
MAGHSKFKNIQHRKGAQDKKRAKIFTKLVREIVTAAKMGTDINNNPRLKNSIIAARSQNLPKDRIDRAISSANDSTNTENYTEIRYEGYAPGGLAIIVEALTDNKNRTASEIRAAFTKFGGNLGETGSVSYMFDHLGIIRYQAEISSAESILESSLEVGAKDMIEENSDYLIYTDIENYSQILEILTAKYGIPTEAYIGWIPKNLITIEDKDKAEKLLKLIDLLEESDDVQNVFAAGNGNRMKSKLPKVMHKVGGKPMLYRVLGNAKEVTEICKFVLQPTPFGTAHAVYTALEAVDDTKIILVLYGDNPFITPKLMEDLLNHLTFTNSAITTLCFRCEDPAEYGRIIVDELGIMAFKAGILKKYLPLICQQQIDKPKELYLTNIVKIAKDKETDNEIYQIIKAEEKRQDDVIELIASENFVSNAVLEATASVLTNKYAEGYPGKRFYNGCIEVDKAENLAIERANQTVFLALLNPHDTILGMSLDTGGHLTHGASPSLSGKWFNATSYVVNKETYLLDYDHVEEMTLKHRPKLIIAGYSAYSRQLDFAKFREIADKVGAYLLADIAHIAGLVATGHHPSPLPYAHAVTSTTHKTLRGPRGGLILSNDEELGKKINLALFPGLQGGPLMHVIAAKAVAFLEALQPDYIHYIGQVIANAKALGKSIMARGYDILTNGTDNHMVLVDLRKYGITGKIAAESLDRAGITCNKNAVPFDSTSPFITSGIRLGTPAYTTKGFKENEFAEVGEMICDILDGLKTNQDNSNCEERIRKQVQTLVRKFPSEK